MFKWIKRLLILIVILIIGAIVAIYFALDGIVKTVVEKEGTEQLKVATTLSGVSLGLVHGTVDLNSLAIASPPGFTAPQMFSVGKLAVDTGGISQLGNKPIHLSSITIDQPKLVIEQHGEKVNFRVLMDNLPKSNEPAGKNSPAGQSQPMKLIIDTLTISNADVQIESDLPGLSSKNMNIKLPTSTTKNIGNADGKEQGAAVKDVATTIITQMVNEATKSGNLPIDLNKSLTENLNGVTDKLDKAAQKQIDKLKLPVDVGGLMNQLTNPKKGDGK